MRNTFSNRESERGVVSIFIVIFSAIFMTLITASFIELMISDQQQATTTDLSQNAYDSAMTGVADAQRGLIYCQQHPGSSKCTELANGSSKDDCQVLGKIGVAQFITTTGTNSEVPIQTDLSASNSLDQAYTCVTLDSQAPNYQATINKDDMTLIPIQSNADVDRVRISWNTAGSTSQKHLPDLRTPGANLLTLDGWNTGPSATDPLSYPPVIQASLITVNPTSINIADFDGGPSAGGSGQATLLLRPQTNPISSDNPTDFASYVATNNLNVTGFNLNGRPAATPGPLAQGVVCDSPAGDVFSASGPYTCSETIALGFTLSAGTTAYLAIQPIYTSADIQIQLQDGPTPQSLAGVQAIVDSTGRANDIFRRVSARVNLVPTNGYPNAALNLSGSLCKDMTVTPAGVVPGSKYTSNGRSCS